MTNTLAHKWNGFAVSIPGFGHIRTEIPCQDASAVITSPREALIVCDGRGSAKLSQLGAQGAVKMFATQIAILDPLIASILDTEEENLEKWNKFCQIMYRTLLQVKLDLAAQHGEEEKEFDFTVAFAITGTHHIGCFQVGDGAIVLRQDENCVTAFEPDKGEFANQTHFLREGGEEKMKFHSALFDARKNSGIAATSDGPEFKMFHLPDMVPGKIFYHLFDDLMAEELDRSDVLTYLTRNDWNTDPRGSDDRSIALLVPQDLSQPIEPEEVAVEEPAAEPEEVAADVPAVEPEDTQKKRTFLMKQEVVHAVIYSLLVGAIITLLVIFQYQTSYIKALEVRNQELAIKLEQKRDLPEQPIAEAVKPTMIHEENEGDFK